MKVCVIGAGIVGCATAFELQRAGHQVTLLGSAMGPGQGQGTTFANGAQLSYSYVEPLANPSTFWSLPKLLFGRTSPVKFCFRADPVQWAWGFGFRFPAVAALPDVARENCLNWPSLAGSPWSIGSAMQHLTLASRRMENSSFVQIPRCCSAKHGRSHCRRNIPRQGKTFWI